MKSTTPNVDLGTSVLWSKYTELLLEQEALASLTINPMLKVPPQHVKTHPELSLFLKMILPLI